MRVSLSSNVNAVLGSVLQLHPQFQFAAAVALTRTAQVVMKAMPPEASRVLDRPTPFTLAGFYTQAARKDRLEATVGVKDRQAQYLWYQVEGGSRKPNRQALRLPSVVQLNEFGNLPSGLVRSLIQRAKAGKRATCSQSRRFGVSQQVDLFYGEPGDGRPAGIYKRVALSTTRHQLIPMVVFPKRDAKYERRFDFYAIAARETGRVFEAELARSWSEALASAR